jgi:hypothetical protein
MKTRFASGFVFVVLMVASACKPGSTGESGLMDTDNPSPPETLAPIDSDTSAGMDSTGSDPPTFEKLQQDMMDALALIPPPRNRVEAAAIDAVYLDMLERRRELLFSIPISPEAEVDRNDAWERLEHSDYDGRGRNLYAEQLLNEYSNASQIEKLVMWDLLRCRMSYWRIKEGELRGSGNNVRILELQMAKFLLPALGSDKHEMFDAMEPKIRIASDEAARRGSQAEEEVERTYIEQSKEAEKILEAHWSLVP